MADTHEERLRRARISLEGLSVGDGFGGFFELGIAERTSYLLKNRKLPPRPWRFTDDTNMALSIYEVLRKFEGIDQDRLAQSFADHFDRTRGYGLGARHLLIQVRNGYPWKRVTYEMFGGEGSFGNGGAMRVAPIGAYFADDMEALVENARLSSKVTHSHPEGIAGAIAVAVAAGVTWNLRGTAATRQILIDQVLPYVPDSEVKKGIELARELPSDVPVWPDIIGEIGNGSAISAQDTVPFVLWCAGERLDNCEEAIWLTASGGGDVDTTCAMVGGIVALHTGVEGIPGEWIKAREPLPAWAVEES
jgi:ADP-ribosylglycohydrolase